MMLQPTRVLPSNASPVHEDDGVHETRILQEHSGNRQHHEYPYLAHAVNDLKYQQSFLSENSYLEQHQPPPHPNYFYQQSNVIRQHHNHGLGRRRPTDHEIACIMQRVRRNADDLCRRFNASDGYVKYRQRQKQNTKIKADQKWPEHLELAFFQALVMWLPVGRHKQTHKDKLRGRNELISDYIFEQTGEKRCRKQVSSHIQVLKPFARGDPVIMKYFSGEPEPKGRLRSHIGRKHTSTYPVLAPPQPIYNGRMPMSRIDTRSWTSFRGPLPVFEPLNFEMFVQQKEQPNVVKRLHTYTASDVTQNSLDEHLQDWAAFENLYPHLANMHRERALNCNVVAAQASIDLTTDTWKDQKGVELGISFSCRSHRVPPPGAKVSCRNRFYVDDIHVEHGNGSPDEVQLSLTEHGHIEGQIKFGSTFWAKNLANLATRLRNGVDPMTGESNGRMEVGILLGGITATQEISVQTEDGQSEALLVIFWRFRLATGPHGQASWHRLVLPSPSLIDCDDIVKDESLDSLMRSIPYDDSSASHQLQPGLQSPFEYDQASSSGSALTSATWSACYDDGLNTAPQSVADFNGDNSFDFHGGNINVSYNDTNFDFSNFDSTAFFDTTTPFAPDPMLEGYSQNDYSTQYCDSYANSFDTQQPMSASDTSFAMTAIDSQSQNVFDGFGEHYDPSFSVGNESQAYGGAGQEVIKEEDPLAALADASYIVEALTQEEHATQE